MLATRLDSEGLSCTFVGNAVNASELVQVCSKQPAITKSELEMINGKYQ